MAINSNRPLQPTQGPKDSSGFDKNSVSNMNSVTKKAIEAVTDLFHDADGDKSDLKAVKQEYAKLSPQEKVAFSTATALTGGAAAMVSLLAEEGLEAAQKISKTFSKKEDSSEGKLQQASGKLKQAAQAMQEQIKHKYDNPPEAKAAQALKKLAHEAGDSVKKCVSDIKENRVLQNLHQNVGHSVKGESSEQSKADTSKRTSD